MKRTLFLGVCLFGLALVAVPSQSRAQTVMTYYYQPQTQHEMIAYLYGRIDQLMEMRDWLEQQAGAQHSEQDQSYRDTSLELSTKSATEVTQTTAVLRGEVIVPDGVTVSAWFEYGQDEDFLDLRTNKVSVRSAYERAIRVGVRYLEPDERYYFRLVTQDNAGVVRYGSIYGFWTDEPDDD